MEIEFIKWAVTVLTILTHATFMEIKWTKKCFYGYSANGNFPNYDICIVSVLLLS